MNIVANSDIFSALERYNRNMRHYDSFGEIDRIVHSMYIQDISEPEIMHAYDAVKNYMVSLGSDPDLFDSAFVFCEAHKRSELEEYNALFKDDIQTNGYAFMRHPFQRGSLSIMTPPVRLPDFSRIFNIGVYLEPVDNHFIIQDGLITESVSELDYQLLHRVAKEMYGNVCIFGFGTGFLPYLLLKNPNVNRIITVDSNKKAYDLTEQILRHFPDNSIEHYQSGIRKFLKGNANELNCIYQDCWKSGDAAYEAYINFLRLENKYKNLKFFHCNEQGFIDMARVNVLQYISAKLGNTAYLNYFRTLSERMYQLLENIPDSVTTIEQLDYYLSDTYIKNMLK